MCVCENSAYILIIAFIIEINGFWFGIFFCLFEDISNFVDYLMRKPSF